MNYLIWTVSLIGILSTAVVCGTDMFFLTVGRPALRLASPSVGTAVMGFIHLFGDARMPVWGISAILSNFVLALFSGSGHRGFYFASLSMLILFVVIYIVCQSQSIGFKPKPQKREEGSTMLASCRHRGIDR
jgi:hypothetical protein